MKIGVHMSMFCKNWTDDIAFSLQQVKKIGYNGVEISLFGAQKQALYNSFEAARHLELEVACGTGISTETDVSSSDECVRKNGIAYLKEAVDTAQKAGASFINGVLYAPWQAFSLGQNKAERWQRSAESLQIVGEYAKQAGISLHCEVLNRFETDFINTLGEGSRFIRMIGLDNVKILADTFHMNIEEDNLAKALTDNLNYIGCIHVCENHRGVPGTGHLPWKELVDVLKLKGYTGYLIIESFVETASMVADAMFTWRPHGSSVFSEAEKGFCFLNKLRN